MFQIVFDSQRSANVIVGDVVGWSYLWVQERSRWTSCVLVQYYLSARPISFKVSPNIVRERTWIVGLQVNQILVKVTNIYHRQLRSGRFEMSSLICSRWSNKKTSAAKTRDFNVPVDWRWTQCDWCPVCIEGCWKSSDTLFEYQWSDAAIAVTQKRLLFCVFFYISMLLRTNSAPHCWDCLTWALLFDCVDHANIVKRLHNVFEIDDIALKWISSFLSNRSQQISYSGKPSILIRLQYGHLPQGSVLGPLLDPLYTAQLFTPMMRRLTPVHLHPV